MGKKMMYIALEAGNVGRYVFLPGSPERTEKIAACFDNSQEIAYNREYRTFVGELEDARVVVTSTGVGGPSAATAAEELHQCGADTMMRVGTCASASPEVSLGDAVIPNGTAKMEGVSLHYLLVELPSMSDFHMLKCIEQAAKNLDYPHNVDATITKASFYTQIEPKTKPAGLELMFKWSVYEKRGTTSTSMECAPPFATGSCLGIRTVCVTASAANCRNYSDNGRNTETDIEGRTIRTAIEAMRIITRNDEEMKQLMDHKETPLLKEMNIPYYVQICDIIYQPIQENVLQEGDTLPGKNILVGYWNVSCSTVRMAVRKPEEDGYVYKMQGKKTMVVGQLARNRDGLQHISNPCTSSCIDTITKAEAVISVQNGGRLIGDLLGYSGKVFTAVAADMKHYVGKVYVASSVAIMPAFRLEQEGIAIDEEEKLKDLALSGLCKRIGRPSLSMSAVEWTEEVANQPQDLIIIAMDEVLYEGEAPLAYHKYRMDSNRYRFTLNRGL